MLLMNFTMDRLNCLEIQLFHCIFSKIFNLRIIKCRLNGIIMCLPIFYPVFMTNVHLSKSFKTDAPKLRLFMVLKCFQKLLTKLFSGLISDFRDIVTIKFILPVYFIDPLSLSSINCYFFLDYFSINFKTI